MRQNTYQLNTHNGKRVHLRRTSKTGATELMLVGIFVILLFYVLGEIAAWLIGGLVPGSVLGMVLLFVALCLKIVKADTVRPAARWLCDNMGLFFLPAGVGIVNAFDILSRNWEAILTACAISTVAVIITVGCIQERFEKRRIAKQQSARP